MVFPATKLPVKVELQLGGVWTNVTAYTYLRDRIRITRGRRDEAGMFEPGECQLTFNNRAGRFSPRNASGPYYGQLTRNTPVRVSIGGTGLPWLYVPASSPTDSASAPDTAGLSVTGDLDLRVELRWPIGVTTTVIRKLANAGQASYALQIFPSGFMTLYSSPDGTTLLSSTSTAVVPTTGRIALRATLDVDNGAAGRTVTFYYSTSIAGPWTQLGDPVVTAGTTTIFDGNSPVTVGLGATGVKIYAAEIRNGIAGTVVASPTFTSQTVGATSFVDAQGNTWSILGGAILTDTRYRYYGEIPSWPQAWDISERDVWTSVAAAGILRRLGQGVAPLKSSLQRFVLRSSVTAYGYWPMEDTEGSTSIASGLAAGSAMTFTGTPRLSADSTILSSNSLPEIGQAAFTGAVNAYTATGTIYAHLMLSVPQAGDVSGVLLRVFTTGTAARWDLVYTAGGGGTLTFQAFDSLGAQIMTTGALAYAVEGVPATVRLQMVQNGANIDWQVGPSSYVAGAGTFGAPTTGTLNSRTVGAATTVQVNPGFTLDQTVVGHVIIYGALPDSASQLAAARGWLGEAAGRRIERLCGEESITFTAVGDLDQTEGMGPQTPQQLLELLAECEASDLGQLFESRDQLGLVYRTRRSRAVQSPLALNYNSLRELTPVEDDQNTRNDVTVTRKFGSSARAAVDTGPLSTQAPPNGVGRYDDQVALSLYTDAQCAQQANWRVTLGTIDEPRYPTLSVELASTTFAASQTLISSALDVDCGDRITVTGTPVWLPPEDIDQHVVGYSEVLGVRDYPIDFVCQPATPTGSAGLYGNAAFRWAADSSTLNGGITSSATSASVATASGPLWTTAGGDFPLDIVIAGERITVSAISGTSSPQTFTFSARGVNGVTKAQSSGAAVQIVDPTYWAL